MAYQSRLELIVDSRSGERELRRFENRLGEVDRAGGQASDSISGMNTRMESIGRLAKAAGGALLGLSAGAGIFTAIARSASQSAREIQNFANLANTTTQEFQRMSFASANFGVEQEKLADILKDVNDRVGEFMQTGSGEMKDFFENIAPKVGVTADQFARLSGPEALQLYYQSLEDANLSQQEMTFYMESMADEASALIPLLQNNSAELDRLTGEADRLDAVLSDMEIQRLRDIRGEFGQLEQQLSTETMRAVSQFDELMKSSLEGISYGINNVARGFNVFMDSFRDGEAKRSIAGIDAELNALFDNRDRLQQRIDMFGADSAQAQDSIVAMEELRTQYTVLIDRKKELQQAGLPVEEPEIVQLDRASTSTDKLTKAQKDAIKEANNHADALNGLLNESDPLRAAHEEYTEQLETLNRGLSEGTITTQEYGEALRWAAGEYTDIASGADDAKKALEQLTQQYDSQYQRGVQLTQAIDDINAAYRRGDIDGQQYGRMIQGVRDEMAELALEADPVAQEMARAWEEASNRIDETFSDAFAGAFDSFDSFADNLLDGFKRLLAELAYQATLKPIVVGFNADMQSMMSGKSASSGGGFGGIGSLINSGKSLLGFGSTAAAPSLAMQGGLSSAALASASQVATGATYSGALGSAASGAALGNSAGLMSSITSGISAAMPWLAGGFAIDNILGLGITDGITKALSGLFGSDRKSYGQIGSQIGGDPNAGDGVYRYDRNDRSMGWAQQTALGTIGVTKKQKTDDDALIAMVDGLAQFDNTLASVMTAAQLEQTRTALDGWKSSRTENIGGLVDERLSAVLNATNSVFTDALSQFEGEALVQGLVGGLQVENVGAQMAAAVAADMNAEFREALGNGSDIQAATQSILSSAQAVQTLGGAVDRLNLQFDATAAGALSAAGNLANLVGGTDNLNSLLSGYYDAFYTEQEKFDDLASDLSATFAEMGRELPSTREGVRELVNGLQLMGSAGQEQLATVLKLTPALREYVTAMEEQRSSIEGVNRAALAQQMFMSSTTADVSNAIDAYNEQLAAIDDVAQARKDQLQQEMRAVEQLSGLIDSLMLSNQSILDPAERLQEAQRQFAELQVRAEGGDMGAISQLQGASSSYLDAAAAYYGQSSSQYADIFGDVNDGISDLERSFGDSLDSLGSIESIEERALQEQKRALSVLESSLRSEIDQVQSLNNMTDLLGALPSELASILAGLLAKPAGGGGGGGPVTSADIQNSVGSVTGAGGFISDSGARDLYNSALENGVSLSEVQKYLPPGNDAVAWAERNGLPVFADGAAFTNGVFDRPTAFPMGLMGEAGSEAIMPLANIGGGLGVNVAGAVDLEPLTRELAALRAEVAMLRAERRNDASVAADQRSKQLGEQKKINKNVKLKERVS